MNRSDYISKDHRLLDDNTYCKFPETPLKKIDQNSNVSQTGPKRMGSSTRKSWSFFSKLLSKHNTFILFPKSIKILPIRQVDPSQHLWRVSLMDFPPMQMLSFSLQYMPYHLASETPLNFLTPYNHTPGRRPTSGCLQMYSLFILPFPTILVWQPFPIF